MKELVSYAGTAFVVVLTCFDHLLWFSELDTKMVNMVISVFPCNENCWINSSLLSVAVEYRPLAELPVGLAVHVALGLQCGQLLLLHHRAELCSIVILSTWASHSACSRSHSAYWAVQCSAGRGNALTWGRPVMSKVPPSVVRSYVTKLGLPAGSSRICSVHSECTLEVQPQFDESVRLYLGDIAFKSVVELMQAKPTRQRQLGGPAWTTPTAGR